MKQIYLWCIPKGWQHFKKNHLGKAGAVERDHLKIFLTCHIGLLCRGRLAQWNNICFVKFHLIRLWFESRRTPSIFYARLIRKKCMTLRLQNKSERISQPRNLAIRIKKLLLSFTQPLGKREHSPNKLVLL